MAPQNATPGLPALGAVIYDEATGAEVRVRRGFAGCAARLLGTGRAPLLPRTAVRMPGCRCRRFVPPSRSRLTLILLSRWRGCASTWETTTPTTKPSMPA